MQKPHIALFDLDGTLCQLYGKRPKKYTWLEAPVKPTLWLIHGMIKAYDKRSSKHFQVWILTGRSKKRYETVTKEWMEFFWVEAKLFMQEWSTLEKNHEYKKKKLIELQKEYYIQFLIDDNEEMANVCKELWIPFYLFKNCY